MDIFTSSLLFEKVPVTKGKDKSKIQCIECSCNNIYIGGKDGVLQHYTTSSKTKHGECQTLREVTKRQMGRSGEISQLKAVLVLNHLLVLWDSSITVLNMFSLEPIAALKKIQNVSLFRLGEPTVHAQQVSVELFAASTKRRAVSILKVCVDRWECVGNVALTQDPVALAVCETCLCVATSDRYILHDYQTQNTLELFTHNLGKQNVLAKESVKGEFLLHGPGNLGMFVLKTGISQRPPVPWLDGVCDAVVHFPYVLVLRSKSLQIYSMLDQQLKQTVFYNNGKSLLSTTDCVFVVTDREIHRLSQTPLELQIQKLVTCERVNEALILLDGVQALLPQDLYENMHRSIVCTSGWIHFYEEDFLNAKELFSKGNLDPRELICLYPDMTLISEDLKFQRPTVSNAKDLRKLNNETPSKFLEFLSFLCLYLKDIRRADLGHLFPQDIDTALFKVYLGLGHYDKLDQLVSSCNNCILDVCVPDLEHHKRFFTIGLLYQSHGQDFNAIQTWVRMVDDENVDSSEPNVLLHIVKTLAQLKEKFIIIEFIDWALQKDQKVGVLIFTGRDPGDKTTFEPQEVLSMLANYPFALILYLEYLVNEQQSQMEKHHTLLANTYITQILHSELIKNNTINLKEMRQKLEQFLWQSSFYDAGSVYVRIQSSALHVEKAILLGRLGEHRKALHLLVDKERDKKAAENYCWRTSAGQDREFTQHIFSCLLQVYLESRPDVPAAVDLLNQNVAAFNLFRVLEVLPGSWSLQLVMRFLYESLRESMHGKRMRSLEKSLARMDNLRQRHAWMEATQGQMVRLDRSLVCHWCRRQLTGPEFLRRSTGELVHTHCYSATDSQ